MQHGNPRVGSGRRGRVVLAAAATVIALAGIAGLLLTGDREGADVTDPVATTTEPTPSTVGDVQPTPTTASIPASTATPTTTVTTPIPTTTTTAAPESLTRPIVDPTVCAPISATGGEPSGLPRDPNASLPLTLFARPSEFPVPIQIIGNPVDGQAKPFALVQRYVDRQRQLVAPDRTESINGLDVYVGTYDNGNGEAEWTLPDGSTGYLRSRGLDREQVIAIIGQLVARPADAPIPGFDYGPTGPDGLELVAEGMNTDPREGTFVGSQCRVESTGLVYRIGAITGTPIFTYASVIDRPPPVDVGVVGDSVITMSGPDDPLAPTVDDVMDADEATWRELLIVPEPDVVSPLLIGGGNEVLVELVPIADLDVPVSPLTLRIDVSDGVASLVVDKRESVVADAADYWKIEIDGRIRLRTSAIPGPGQGVSGTRLGDVSTFEPRHEFTVRVSTTDGDDQTIQTTGEVRLFVST